MSRCKIELNRSGVRQLLRSEEMKSMLKAKADAAAKACGDGYEAGSYVMLTRAVARVSAATIEAKQDNLANNTFLKVLGVSAASEQSASAGRSGKKVQGYYRTTRSGKRIYVKSYQRRK